MTLVIRFPLLVKLDVYLSFLYTSYIHFVTCYLYVLFLPLLTSLYAFLVTSLCSTVLQQPVLLISKPTLLNSEPVSAMDCILLMYYRNYNEHTKTRIHILSVKSVPLPLSSREYFLLFTIKSSSVLFNAAASPFHQNQSLTTTTLTPLPCDWPSFLGSHCHR